ncbi:MAG: glutathione S-transferase family protein [Hyphomicrobiales bacterium]|nr:glutathione S-transferase family protein [Hyphomicrobiales bacterium]
MTLHLISHTLCPYVQRAAISLAEKGVAFERSYIDLANKPDWFLAISPLGKTPVLLVDEVPIFESSAILEYLEDTQPNPLHPADPLERARHRAWIEFGSAVLNDIVGFYAARDELTFVAKRDALRDKFVRLDRELGPGPYFAGESFSLVDVVFGPVFRYFDTFDRIEEFGILTGLASVDAWRSVLAGRSSIASAVTPDYPDLLEQFIERRGSRLSERLEARLLLAQSVLA